MQLPENGLVAVVKRDCPTCEMLEPVYRQLRDGPGLTVFSQDDPTFPEAIGGAHDDRDLERSYRLDVETVPTLIRLEGGREAGRAIGWHRGDWEAVTGIEGLGADLPEWRPGCGSKSVEPGMAEILKVRFGDARFGARPIELGDYDDPIEATYERGWSDGLPVVPPTEVRVLRMLRGTTRAPDEIIGSIPPNLAPCTVEKAAINAVMAGCKPEYFPVVLAAIEAALIPEFTMHGLLCTTYFAGPVVVVNGPIAKAIGMNWGGNALGQGNRANATIGRALQLVIRNVGGGIPGGIDRATLGQPGKYTFCFAEDETDPTWEPWPVTRGFAAGTSTVSLFAGDGVMSNFDQISRTPDSLVRSLAMSLWSIGHPKKVQGHDALLVLSPEHYRIFRDAGWDRARILAEFEDVLRKPGSELVRGAGGVMEGVVPEQAEGMLSKFRPGGLHIVRAGGQAGLMSAIIGGWASGARGSVPVTKEVKT